MTETDWGGGGAAATSQEHQGPPEAVREAGNRVSLGASIRSQYANTLIVGFWALKL